MDDDDDDDDKGSSPELDKDLQKEITKLKTIVQDLKIERNKEHERSQSLSREVNRLQEMVADKDDYDGQSQGGSLRRSFRSERKMSYSRKSSDVPQPIQLQTDPLLKALEAEKEECNRLRAELAATRRKLSQSERGRPEVDRDNSSDEETKRLRREVKELKTKLAYSDLQLVQGKDIAASLTNEASSLKNEVKRLQEKLRESTLQRNATEEYTRAMRKESANLRRSVRELEEQFAEVERKFGSFVDDD